MSLDTLKEERVVKLWMLGVMLSKLHELYPEFANQVTWEDAHVLLAEFCVPEEFRNVVPQQDWYYISRVSHELAIPIAQVYEGFQLASQSEES